MSGAQAVRALERLGFQKARQRGSHVVMRRGDSGCVIPLHPVLTLGTLRGCLKQARVSAEEFMRHLS
ncbi:MAG: type II toxin-antitoxin system HicA family toxin [Bryobacteraceae bacterium]